MEGLGCRAPQTENGQRCEVDRLDIVFCTNGPLTFECAAAAACEQPGKLANTNTRLAEAECLAVCLPETTGELTANGRAARPALRHTAFGRKPKVSSPPQDGRPRRLTDRQPHLTRRKSPR